MGKSDFHQDNLQAGVEAEGQISRDIAVLISRAIAVLISGAIAVLISRAIAVLLRQPIVNAFL